jgi:hypothetical protein
LQHRILWPLVSSQTWTGFSKEKKKEKRKKNKNEKLKKYDNQLAEEQEKPRKYAKQ